ncbi:unnamed protein product [Ixodes pacificus]
MLCTNRNVGSDGQVSPVFSALFCTFCLCVHLQKNMLPAELLRGATTFPTCTVQGNKMQFIQKKIKSCHAKFWFLALVPDMGGCPNQSNFSLTSHQFVVKVPDSRVLGSRFTFIVSPTDHATTIRQGMHIDKC